MNNKIRNFIERLSIVLWAQIYSMLISGVTAFIMPKYFSIQAYSYYQLENLYCGYIWIISLGIPNGFFLKYGGKKRGEFNKSEITSQVAVYTMYIVLISILLIVTALIFGKDASKKFVFILSVIITAHEIIFNMLAYIMQASNSMKQYMRGVILLRTLSLIFLITGILFHVKNFKFLIAQDLISKIMVNAIMVFSLRDVLFGRIWNISYNLKKLIEMFQIGISIYLSSYANSCIKIMIQNLVENVWGLLVFGKIALCFSISSLFTKLVSAAGLVLYSSLRKAEAEKQSRFYNALNSLIPIIMLFLFCFYFPAVIALKKILPSYADSLKFMAVLLPGCIYEVKTVFLINTYLQIIHREKEILYSNIVSVGFCLCLSGLTAYVFHELVLVVGAVSIAMGFRCWYEERRLLAYVKETETRNSGLWVILSVFVFCSWFLKNVSGVALYALTLLLYIVLKKEEIRKAIESIYRIGKR